MKSIKSVVLALSLVFVAFGSKANTTPDEGMWLPMLINKNYDEMKKIGFKLSADDIYNVNNSSLEAVALTLRKSSSTRRSQTSDLNTLPSSYFSEDFRVPPRLFQI